MDLEKATLRETDLRARPFVKWAGGKRSILPELNERNLLPQEGVEGRYFEPFVGGGAVFFWLTPNAAILNDANPTLMAAYRMVRDELPALIDRLTKLEAKFLRRTGERRQTLYYDTRDEFNAEALEARDGTASFSVETVAKFIFLNKTCFNGLYRENQAGEFNVPIGGYESPTICDPTGLRTASLALQDTKLLCGDYAAITRLVTRGDFVYCDPPYTDPDHRSSFRSYTMDGFGWAEQERLAETAKEWAEKGARVLLTNHLTDRIRELYESFDFTVESIDAPRSINSDGTSRDAIPESVIRNYET